MPNVPTFDILEVHLEVSRVSREVRDRYDFTDVKKLVL